MDTPQQQGRAAQGGGFMETLSVQVEDALLDTYDLVYDQAVMSPSGARRQELAAIHDTVRLVGRPPLPGTSGPTSPHEDCDPENGLRAAPGQGLSWGPSHRPRMPPPRPGRGRY